MSDDLLKTLLETPYVAKFGIRFERKGDELTGVLPYDEHLVGNPLVPALHGGAVGAFMEVVGSGALIAAQKLVRLPKPIDVAVDYLRPARPVDVYARAVTADHGAGMAPPPHRGPPPRAGGGKTLPGHFLIKPEAVAG